MYVDDIIVTGSNSQEIDRFVKTLDAQFALKDIGQLSYFLGIEVKYTSNGIVLSQAKYIRDLFQKVAMDRSNALPTPMVATNRLAAEEGSSLEDDHQYRSILGALQYVVITRPDIA